MTLLAKQPHQESPQTLPWGTQRLRQGKKKKTRLDTCPQWKKEQHTWRVAPTKGAQEGINSNWRGDCVQSVADLYSKSIPKGKGYSSSMLGTGTRCGSARFYLLQEVFPAWPEPVWIKWPVWDCQVSCAQCINAFILALTYIEHLTCSKHWR